MLVFFLIINFPEIYRSQVEADNRVIETTADRGRNEVTNDSERCMFIYLLPLSYQLHDG